MKSAKKARIALSEPERAISKMYEIIDTDLLGRTRTSIFDREWDTLIVLDACRADYYKSESQLPGKVETIRSVGSKTGEWLTETFGTSSYGDIVYASANPNLTTCDATFHERIRLWESEWDDALEVVRPEAVSRRAIRAAEKYPNKRHIVHFMQPHIPLIGETGQMLVEDGRIDAEGHGVKFWKQMRHSERLTKGLKTAYRENVNLVLPEAERIWQNVDGKTVVTSDHGNAFGWFGVYGHPGGVYAPGVVKVPWHELPFETRRSIHDGQASAGPADEIEVRDQLESLGYV